MAENKKIYVPDASVILKWFLEETDSQDEAFTLRDDYHRGEIVLEIPQYAMAEIINTLGRKLSHDATLAYFSRLLLFRIIESYISPEIASLAIILMKKFPGISFYDAGYHALALHRGAKLITADEKYYKKTHRAGNIMLLKDYGKKRRYNPLKFTK